MTAVDGSYRFEALPEGDYVVTAFKPHWACIPAFHEYPALASNQADQDFSCHNVADGSAISGTVVDRSGKAISDAEVTLSGACTQTVTTDGGGAYTFSALPVGDYSVSVSKTGRSCQPPNRYYGALHGDQLNQTFICDSAASAGGYRISGVVSDAANHPLAGATVALSGAKTETATTRDDGAYLFTGLAQGNYTVSAAKEGYGCQPPSRYYNSLHGDQSSQHFTCAPSPRGAGQGYKISGKIVDAANQPLAGVGVTLSGPGGQWMETGPDGVYWFNGLSASGYTVIPIITGHACQPPNRSYPPLTGDLEAQDFRCVSTVPAGGYAIGGTIRDSSATPLAGISARLSGARSQAVTTGASGAFTFTGLLPGDYTIVALNNDYICGPDHRNYLRLESSFSSQDFTCALAVAAPAAGGNASVYTISGVVSVDNAGADGFVVTVSGAATRTMTTASGGSYSFSGLGPGDYTVAAGKPGFSCQPPNRFYSELHGDQVNQNFHCVAVTGNTGSFTHSISGSVRTAAGPLSGATVTLSGPTFQSVMTGADGVYYFTGLLAGDYTVTAGKSGYSCAPPSRFYPMLPYTPIWQDYLCTELRSGYTISGTVALAGEIPAGAILATLSGARQQTMAVGPGGAYSFPALPTGAYTVALNAPGYSCLPAMVAVGNLQSNLPGQDFRCEKSAGYAIMGKVIDPTGSALSGAAVTLTGPQSRTMATGPDGAYSFSGLATGDYTVTAAKASYTCQPGNVFLSALAADQANQNFTCSAVPANVHTISGSVVDGSNQPLSNVTVKINGGSEQLTSATGAYAFRGLAEGAYIVAASKGGYRCLPSAHSYAPLKQTWTAQDFTCAAIPTSPGFTISGVALERGTPLAGVSVTLTTPTGAVTVPTDATGLYVFTGLVKTAYTVAMSQSGYSCEPPSRFYAALNGDQWDQNFACAASVRGGSGCAIAGYSIGGTVSDDAGRPVSAARVSLAGLQSLDAFSDANGQYCFTGLPQGSNFAATAYKAGYSCRPVVRQYVALNADQIQQDFVCALPGAVTIVLSCPANTAQAGQAYSSSLATSGGKPPYGYSVAGGSLPTGFTLNSATGAVTGTSSSAGTFSFTVEAQDANGARSGTAACSITVVKVPLAASCPSATAQVGEPYSSGFSPAGGIPPYRVEGSGSLPSGLTLDAATGALTGKPTVPGAFSFTAQTTDSSTPAETVSRVCSIQVAPAPPPVVVSLSCPAARTALTGQAYSSALIASGGAGPYEFSIVSGVLPAGLTLNAASGAITGAPASEGTFAFEASAKDKNGVASSTGACSIAVSTPPPASLLATCPVGPASLGEPYASSVTALGGASPYAFALASGSLPAGLALNATTGAVTGTPTIAGVFSFSVRATDSSTPAANTATASCKLVISPLSFAHFTTFTQGGWGAAPNGNNPGALLANYFAVVYGASPVSVGGATTLSFTGPAKIRAFLPQGGKADVLDRTATDPTDSSAGVLAGQLLAAQLNLDFSDAQITRAGLGALKLVSGPFGGASVREVMVAANRVLGGDLSALPEEANLSDLVHALDAINQNFDNGTQNLGLLRE